MFSYYFFCLCVELFTCVNPPLGNFTNVLNFFPSNSKFYNIYTHSTHLLGIWIWLTVYDLRKNTGQDFWIWLWPWKEHWTIPQCPLCLGHSQKIAIFKNANKLHKSSRKRVTLNRFFYFLPINQIFFILHAFFY